MALVDEAEAGPLGAPPTSLLRIATSGSVDDGKSTLIGRLLFDTKQIFRDQLEAVERTSMERGDGYVNLALLTDGLRAEREQGITIDVAYRYFSTPRRKFILADTPGHERYTRNMVTGASTADLAIVLVDARHGVVEQTRRHSYVASLLRIPHLVVAVNKMDLVDYDRGVYERIEKEFRSFESRLQIGDITFMPISALAGDNVVHRSENTPWYEGPPLLYHLEHVHVAPDRNLIDARFPVQWVIRPMREEHHDYRGYAGQVASGILRPGEEVIVLPSGQRSRITIIDSLDGPLDEAYPPMAATVLLEDDLDISRGDMICRPHNRPTVAREIEAQICWFDDTKTLTRGSRYVIKHTTRTAKAVVDAIRYRIDVNTLHRVDADELGLNDLGRVALRTSSPLMFDAYRDNRATGSFILIDESSNDTVAAGMILGVHVGELTSETTREEHSTNVVWSEGSLSREDRWRKLGRTGATVWLTGLSASGKSTIAARLEERLVREGFGAYRLDGDNLRHGLNGNLGFDRAARDENVRRTAHVAALMADSGTITLVSLVSPYRDGRAQARALHEAAAIEFIEVFVDTPLEVCEERDPKGLYAKARAGEILEFTGVDDPYEPPEAPDVLVKGATEPVDDAVDRIIALLRDRGAL